jgi:ABC-type uncharacterized transport system permease subunit
VFKINRANGVNHIVRIQRTRPSMPSLTCGYLPVFFNICVGFGLNLGTTNRGNSLSSTVTVLEHVVGGISDRVDFFICDITFDNLDCDIPVKCNCIW